MTAKEYLQQIRKNDIRINQLLKEVDNLRKMTVFIKGIDYTKDRVQSTSDGTTGALKSIEKLYDAEIRLDRMIDRYVNEKQRIVSEIQSLDRPEYIELLYMRYINYMSLEAISVEMNYSYNRIKHLHGAALQTFYNKFLKDDTK